jgi:hypothetical protein
VREEDAIAFAAASLNSVWALELLLLLRRDPSRAWQAEALIRELRSSQVVVGDALQNLEAAGLTITAPDGRYSYHARTPELDELVLQLEELYRLKPMALMKAIVTSPNKNLQVLSDAFKLKR